MEDDSFAAAAGFAWFAWVQFCVGCKIAEVCLHEIARS